MYTPRPEAPPPVAARLQGPPYPIVFPDLVHPFPSEPPHSLLADPPAHCPVLAELGGTFPPIAPPELGGMCAHGAWGTAGGHHSGAERVGGKRRRGDKRRGDKRREKKARTDLPDADLHPPGGGTDAGRVLRASTLAAREAQRDGDAPPSPQPRPNHEVVRCMRALLSAGLNSEAIGDWMHHGGHAASLQGMYDARCEDAVDMGEGAIDFLVRKGTVRRVNSSFARAADSLCDMSDAMTEEQWYACTLVLVRAGLVRMV